MISHAAAFVPFNSASASSLVSKWPTGAPSTMTVFATVPSFSRYFAFTPVTSVVLEPLDVELADVAHRNGTNFPRRRKRCAIILHLDL